MQQTEGISSGDMTIYESRKHQESDTSVEVRITFFDEHRHLISDVYSIYKSATDTINLTNVDTLPGRVLASSVQGHPPYLSRLIGTSVHDNANLTQMSGTFRDRLEAAQDILDEQDGCLQSARVRLNKANETLQCVILAIDNAKAKIPKHT